MPFTSPLLLGHIPRCLSGFRLILFFLFLSVVVAVVVVTVGCALCLLCVYACICVCVCPPRFLLPLRLTHAGDSASPFFFPLSVCLNLFFSCGVIRRIRAPLCASTNGKRSCEVRVAPPDLTASHCLCYLYIYMSINIFHPLVCNPLLCCAPDCFASLVSVVCCLAGHSRF